MNRTKIARVAGAAAAVGALGIAGATLANADPSATTPTPSSTAGAGNGNGNEPRGGPGHTHTPVTGDELAKVTAAVKAKDSAVTVTQVEKDPDGSYDVDGTKAGAKVRVEVSKDLKTIEVRTGGPGGRGPKDSGTAVTGTEKSNVEKAAKAKVSGLTVEEVRKRADGSYVVRGTKAGAPTRVEVSKDLKTVTERPGWGRGGRPGGGPGGTHTPVTGAELAKVTAAVKAKDSAVTVTGVEKDADGSYDVAGTKAGQPVRVEVSKDLTTIEVRTGGPGGRGHGRGPGDRGGQPTTGAPTPSPTGTA